MCRVSTEQNEQNEHSEHSENREHGENSKHNEHLCCRYPNYAWVAQEDFGSVWHQRRDILAVQYKEDRGPVKWDKVNATSATAPTAHLVTPRSVHAI